MIDPVRLASERNVQATEDILRFRDTDANGHVNNATFSVLAESGRVQLFRRHITPFLTPGTFFVVARLAIDFRAELHYPGSVTTLTWLSRVGRTSLGVEQVIVSGERIAAETEAVIVLMDGATRRPTPFNDETLVVARDLVRGSRSAGASVREPRGSG